jgi:DNA-binding transcriptional regulator YiaG
VTAQELKTARKALRLTQEALGAEIGVTVHAVRLWEQGRRKVPAYAAKAIERIPRSTR